MGHEGVHQRSARRIQYLASIVRGIAAPEEHEDRDADDLAGWCRRQTKQADQEARKDEHDRGVEGRPPIEQEPHKGHAWYDRSARDDGDQDRGRDGPTTPPKGNSTVNAVVRVSPKSRSPV